MESKFKFELGATVALACSNESGEVIGRAEYKDNDNQYQIRYCAADGRAVETWWAESAIKQ